MATSIKTVRARLVGKKKGPFATPEEASLAKNEDLLIALKRFEHQLPNSTKKTKF